MTVGAIQAHGLAIGGTCPRRRIEPTRGRLIDAVRVATAIVLVVLALAVITAAGAFEGLTALPADGPAPGLGLVWPLAHLDQRGWQ